MNSSGAIDVKINGSALDEKSTFKMLGMSFSTQLGRGSCIVCIDKTASMKIGTLIRSIKFILRVRSINLPSDLAFCLVGTFSLIGNVPLVGTRYTD